MKSIMIRKSQSLSVEKWSGAIEMKFRGLSTQIVSITSFQGHCARSFGKLFFFYLEVRMCI